MVKKNKSGMGLSNGSMILWNCVKRLFHAHRVFGLEPKGLRWMTGVS